MTVVIDSRNPRSLAALGLAVRAGSWASVRTKDGQQFHGIPSRTEPGVVHIADTQVCTCPDRKYRGVARAHIIAARLHQEQQEAKAALKARRSAPSPAYTPEQIAAGSARYVDLFPSEVG